MYKQSDMQVSYRCVNLLNNFDEKCTLFVSTQKLGMIMFLTTTNYVSRLPSFQACAA